MPKKSSSTKIFSNIGWHFFLPALSGFIVTFIFSESMTLSLKVGAVVLLFSFVAHWAKKQ